MQLISVPLQVSGHPASYHGLLCDHVCILVRDEVTKVIKNAPPVIYFNKNGWSHKVPEEKETIIYKFISTKLSGLKFLDGPWDTAMVRSSTFHHSCTSNLWMSRVVRTLWIPLMPHSSVLQWSHFMTTISPKKHCMSLWMRKHFYNFQ